MGCQKVHSKAKKERSPKAPWCGWVNQASVFTVPLGHVGEGRKVMLGGAAHLAFLARAAGVGMGLGAGTAVLLERDGIQGVITQGGQVQLTEGEMISHGTTPVHRKASGRLILAYQHSRLQVFFREGKQDLWPDLRTCRQPVDGCRQCPRSFFTFGQSA